MIIYILLLFLPTFFLIGRGRKEVFSVIALIALFLLVHRLFLTGQQTVTHDTMTWSMYLLCIKDVLQSGHLPGWNPYFSCGEPFYLYHYSYMFWQWFLFVLLDYVWPIEPVALFNLFFIFLFIFYNVGCYLFFQKIFEDKRVVLFCFATSLYATSFVMYFLEHSSFYLSVYAPYLLYFFLEYIENQSRRSLVFLGGLAGMMFNGYLPQFPLIAFSVFVVCYLVFMRGKYRFPQLDKETLVYATTGVILLLLIASPCLYAFSQFSDYISPKRAGLQDVGSTYDQLVIGHHQEYSAASYFVYFPGMRGILFIGFLALILAVIGALKSSNRFHLPILGSAIAIFFISLGANSFSQIIISYVPIFNLIRHYAQLEIFVQMFAICLAGMGLEYILSARKETNKGLLILLSIVSLAILALLLEFIHKPPVPVWPSPIKPDMYLVLFTISIMGIYILITHRTHPAFYFFFMMSVLGTLSLQWYLGYRALNYIRESNHNSAEPKNFTALLENRVTFSWKEQRDRSIVDGMQSVEHLFRLLDKIKKEIGQSGCCSETLIKEVDRYLCSPEICSIFKSHGYVPALDGNSLTRYSDVLKEPPLNPTKIADDILVRLQSLIAKNLQLFNQSMQENDCLGSDCWQKFLERFNADVYKLDHAIHDCLNAICLGNVADAEVKLRFVEDTYADMQRRLRRLQDASNITDEPTALSIFEDNFGERLTRLRSSVGLVAKTFQNFQNQLYLGSGRMRAINKYKQPWGG